VEWREKGNLAGGRAVGSALIGMVVGAARPGIVERRARRWSSALATVIGEKGWRARRWAATKWAMVTRVLGCFNGRWNRLTGPTR
jgi:hypothetical protein